MARIPIYRHSILASLLNIIAAMMMMGGLAAAFGGEILAGIVLFVLGMGVTLLGSMLAEHTKYRAIIRNIKKNGLEDQLRNDLPAIFKVYNACPGREILRYIESLNPEAAKIIREQLAAQKKQKKA